MPGTALQLKATIVGTKPPVWRRVVVREDMTLARLHGVLQDAFGWSDSHLHEFEIEGIRYGVDDGEGWGDPPRDERRTRVGDIVAKGARFIYVYDFGDNWEHRIVVEDVLPIEPGATLPACTGGRRACPPEDCGGVYGYGEFLAALGDPTHPEHEAMSEWIGGSFDPDAFDRPDLSDLR